MMMMMSGSFSGLGVESSGAAGQRSSSSSVDGLMLGERNSNSQQQQRKRQRCAESVPEDEIERAHDFLKQEAELAEEEARLSHERQQQIVQIQQEETTHEAQLAQERAGDATGAQLAIADVTTILGQQPDLLAPAHEQQQAQSARDEEFEEAELAREFSRQRALHNQRARAQWAQLLQCPIEDVTSILRQRPYLLTQSRDQLAQSARELAQERARLPESRSAEISRRRALYFQRTRAQWAQLLQCPIADVTSILQQRPELLAQSPDQLAQSGRELAQERARLLESRSAAEFGPIQVPPRAQWSERALLIERGHAELARVERFWLNEDQRRRQSSEQKISEYLEPRVRPSRDQDKEEMCTVCHNHLYDEENKIYGGIATLDCRHEYHKNCIKLWLLRKNVCPLCNRTAIPC